MAALDEGARAPEIGLSVRGGEVVRVADLRESVVLVDFWASWCEPCREEMPVLDRLYKKYRDHGFTVIGVNLDRRANNMHEFLQQLPVSFPVVHDADHEVAGRYRPSTMPSSYLIDKRGIVRYVHRGFRASDAVVLERQIKRLLGIGQTEGKPNPE